MAACGYKGQRPVSADYSPNPAVGKLLALVAPEQVHWWDAGILRWCSYKQCILRHRYTG